MVRKAADEYAVSSQLTEICLVQLQYLRCYHVLLNQRLLTVHRIPILIVYCICTNYSSSSLTTKVTQLTQTVKLPYTNSNSSNNYNIVNIGLPYTPHLEKNCAKLFLPELRHISTNFDNYWHNCHKEAKIMLGALIFHLT